MPPRGLLDMFTQPSGGLLDPSPPSMPTPGDELYWFLRNRGANEQARQRIQQGNAFDTDFYISPFAPNRFHDGPVGPGGAGFGKPQFLVGDKAFERRAPDTPDRAMITPELLQLWSWLWSQGTWGI